MARRAVGAVLAVAMGAVGLTTAPTGIAEPATPQAAVGVDERVVVGETVLGRPIVAYHRSAGDPSADGTRTLVVIGSMHGDEDAGKRVVRRLRRIAVPAGLELWLVPTVNPDGDVVDRRTNARGVDLNRNFRRYWRLEGAGTTKYSGPRVASEPETRATARFLRQVAPRTTIVFHQPLFGVDSYRAKSMRLVRSLSRGTGLPVRSFDCRGGCHGTLTDWHNARLDGRAVTLELGRTASRARIARVARTLLDVGSR